jgi:hypothetical protein
MVEAEIKPKISPDLMYLIVAIIAFILINR